MNMSYLFPLKETHQITNKIIIIIIFTKEFVIFKISKRIFFLNMTCKVNTPKPKLMIVKQVFDMVDKVWTF